MRRNRPTRAEKPRKHDPEQPPDLPLQIAQQALDRLLSSIDSVDSKISNAFTWGGALVGLLSAVLALRPERFHGKALICFFVAIALFAVLALLTLLAVTVQTWRSGPKAEDIIQDYRQGRTETVAKWKATRAFMGSIEENAIGFDRKVRILRAVWILLALQTGAVIAGLAFIAG